MDKTFIMNIDENIALLGKELPLGSVLEHPVPFPLFETILVKRKDAVSTLTELLKGYESRTFIMTPDNYGLDVSINYKEGVFSSMILKGSGVAGERISDTIATMFVPKESKSKKDITLHALITVQDTRDFRRGLTKHDIPSFLRQRLMDGFAPYEDKKIVCRPIRLYVDGVPEDINETWERIADMLITGLSMLYDHASAMENAAVITDYEGHYLLPQRGVIITDDEPLTDGAFPETRLLFDEESY